MLDCGRRRFKEQCRRRTLPLGRRVRARRGAEPRERRTVDEAEREVNDVFRQSRREGVGVLFRRVRGARSRSGYVLRFFEFRLSRFDSARRLDRLAARRVQQVCEDSHRLTRAPEPYFCDV